MRINYHGEDWLFLEGFTILADGERFVLDVPPDSLKRDHARGYVWEWYDAQVPDPGVWEQVAAAQQVTLRLHGDTYHSDRRLTRRELEGMRVVLDAYRMMKEEG